MEQAEGRMQLIALVVGSLMLIVGSFALWTGGGLSQGLISVLIGLSLALVGSAYMVVRHLLRRLQAQVSETNQLRVRVADLQRDAREHSDEAAQLQLLTRVLRRLAESRDVRDVSHVLLEESLAFFHAHSGKVFLVVDSSELELLESVPPDEERTRLKVGIGRGMVSDVAATGVPKLIPDERQLLRSERRQEVGAESAMSAMCVPIISEGKVGGVILVEEQSRSAFSERDKETLMLIARQAGIALERARLYTEWVRLSVTDGLTGVGNRRHIEARLTEELERARREDYPLSLIMLDIDRFKQFNDTYGHLTGDAILKTLASTLSRTCRRTDIVGRYGGEEFVVIAPQTDEAHAVTLAENLRRTVEQTPFLSEEGQTLHVTISLGVACFPKDSDNERDLIHAADEALLCAKKAGRNRSCVYDEGVITVR